MWVGVGGRGSNHGNRWRDLDQIWLAGFPHAREWYRLCDCDCVMGTARGRGMGVGGRANIDLGNRWMDFDQI